LTSGTTNIKEDSFTEKMPTLLFSSLDEFTNNVQSISPNTFLNNEHVDILLSRKIELESVVEAIHLELDGLMEKFGASANIAELILRYKNKAVTEAEYELEFTLGQLQEQKPIQIGEGAIKILTEWFLTFGPTNWDE